MFERRRKIGVAGVAAFAATALLAAGCGSSGSSSNSSSSTGASVSGAVATVANLNGAGANCIYPFAGTQCYSVTNYEDFEYLMVRPLYMFGGNSNTSISVNYPLSPASAPVYSNGGKTVVINMKGWKWSDGTSVDANSLMLYLNLLEAEKSAYYRLHAWPPAGQPRVVQGDRPGSGHHAAQAGLLQHLVHLQPAGHPDPDAGGVGRVRHWRQGR